MSQRKEMTNDAGIAAKIARDLHSHDGAETQIEVVEGGFRVEGRDPVHGRWSVLPPEVQATEHRASWNVVQVEGRSGAVYDVVVYSGF
jgi:hypothetical protein